VWRGEQSAAAGTHCRADAILIVFAVSVAIVAGGDNDDCKNGFQNAMGQFVSGLQSAVSTAVSVRALRCPTRARETACVCACACVRACVCACEWKCVRVCVRWQGSVNGRNTGVTVSQAGCNSGGPEAEQVITGMFSVWSDMSYNVISAATTGDGSAIGQAVVGMGAYRSMMTGRSCFRSRAAASARAHHAF
jgi:hypothetical protein